jgi:hypothetical protein
MALIIIPLVVIIALLIPADYSSYNVMPVLLKSIPLMFVPSIAWLIFQFRQLALYNVDKSHGMQAPYREFLVFLIYWITFMLPLSLPAIATSILEPKSFHLVSVAGITWKVVVVMAFYIAIFFSVFKQVRAKNFFLNFAVCGGILFLLNTLMGFFMMTNVFVHGIFYLTLIAAAYAIIGFATRRRDFMLHQSTILLNIIMPIIGIILFAYIANLMELFGPVSESAYDPGNGSFLAEEAADLMEGSWLARHAWEILLWSGLILHLFVWNSLFKRAYMRLWNQPKEK